VQWHPEASTEHALFRALVDAAASASRRPFA
jgi:gamma-glutamyl-gamma-aminobutyrate hydrolase PuuD